MSWAAVAVAGAAVVGAVVQSSSSRRAERSQTNATRAGIEAQNQGLDIFNQRTQPTVNLGNAAGVEIARLLGLSLPDQGINDEISTLQDQLASIDQVIAAGPPKKKGGHRGGLFGGLTGGLVGGLVGDPITGTLLGDRRGRSSTTTGPFDLEGLQSQRADILSQIDAAEARQQSHLAQPVDRMTQLDEINPLVSFLRDQGFEGIQESAAARGRLGAGGTLKDLTRFNTDLASTVVPQLQQQRFNQLANILGIGSNAATGQGNAALQTSINTSNSLGNIGRFQAQNAQNQAGITTNALNNLATIGGGFAGGAFAGNASSAQSQQPQLVGGIQNPNQFEAFA